MAKIDRSTTREQDHDQFPPSESVSMFSESAYDDVATKYQVPAGLSVCVGRVQLYRTGFYSQGIFMSAKKGIPRDFSSSDKSAVPFLGSGYQRRKN
jgi:hypothetical protein